MKFAIHMNTIIYARSKQCVMMDYVVMCVTYDYQNNKKM